MLLQQIEQKTHNCSWSLVAKVSGLLPSCGSTIWYTFQGCYRRKEKTAKSPRMFEATGLSVVYLNSTHIPLTRTQSQPPPPNLLILIQWHLNLFLYSHPHKQCLFFNNLFCLHQQSISLRGPPASYLSFLPSLNLYPFCLD